MKFASKEKHRQYLTTEISHLIWNNHRCIEAADLERVGAEYRREHTDTPFSIPWLTGSVFKQAFGDRSRSKRWNAELEIELELLHGSSFQQGFQQRSKKHGRS